VNWGGSKGRESATGPWALFFINAPRPARTRPPGCSGSQVVISRGFGNVGFLGGELYGDEGGSEGHFRDSAVTPDGEVRNRQGPRGIRACSCGTKGKETVQGFREATEMPKEKDLRRPWRTS